jgi:hypothetical protein
MHPVVKRFSERRPRLYGLIALIAAFALTFIGQKTGVGTIAFLLILSSVGFGVTGILYMVMGSKCTQWNARFVASFNPRSVSWGQALALVSFGLALFALSLYWLVR